MFSGITMAQSGVARHNSRAARIDQLAADWASGRQKREVAAEKDRANFCERAQSLFDDVSGMLWRNTSWNVFDVLGRPRLEDAHTRVIAWLMNPTKSSRFPGRVPKSFLQEGVPHGRTSRHT